MAAFSIVLYWLELPARLRDVDCTGEFLRPVENLVENSRR